MKPDNLTVQLPIYLKTDVPYNEAPNCSVFSSSGEKINPEQYGIQIGFRDNGGGIVNLPNNESVNFSSKLWQETQKIGKDYFLKIGLDGDRIWIGRRKFLLNVDDDETINDIPIDDITIETTRLSNLVFDPRLFVPIRTGKYIDLFWSRSGGILPATNIMVTGDPGIGKSSNLMDMLVDIIKQDSNKRVLYVSAEMTAIDLQEFLQFYPGLENIDFLFLGEYVTDPNQKIKPYQALESTLNQGWDVVVIDSLYETQSMIQEDLDISSFKKGERYMLDLMNKHNSGHNKLNLYTAFLAIQQQNKSGQYVGSKRLEHMTTGFLQMMWDPKERGKRFMMFEKNRKGKEKVKLYYSLHKEKGIIYDDIRHIKESEFIELLQQTSGASLDEMNQIDFEKIFSEKKGDDVAIPEITSN